EVKKLRGFEDYPWKFQIEVLIDMGANNFREMDLVQRYRGIEENPGLRWIDIEERVKTFPSGSAIDAALGKGFTVFTEFDEAQGVGCPTRADYLIMKSRGFKTHKDRLLAEEKGYISADEWNKGREVGANNFDEYQEMFQRGFLSIEDMYLAERKGFYLSSEYKEGMSKGFTNAKDLRVATKHRIPNYKKFEEMINFGVEFDKWQNYDGDESLYNKYLQALKTEFVNFKEYLAATQLGFAKHNDYRKALNGGFEDYREYKLGKDLGFTTADMLREAKELGYKNYAEYQLGKSSGCPNAKCLHEMLEAGFKTWNQYQDAKQKNFSDLTTYQSAIEAKAPTHSEYKSMIKAGFNQYPEYQSAKQSGFPLKEQFEEGKRRGIPNYKIMLEMDNLGYDQYNDYKSALERGFTGAKEYLRAQKMGAPDYKAFEELILHGYNTFSDFLTANSLGYPDAQSYQNGLKLHAHHFQEYQILNVKGQTREDFVSKSRKDLESMLADVVIWENGYRLHMNDDESDDFDEITENLEKLQQLYANVTDLYHNLPDWGDTFQELLIIIQNITSKLIALESEIKTLLTRLYDIHDPIKEMLRHLSQITIPGILPETTIADISSVRSIGKKKLLELFNKFFPEVLQLHSDAKTYQILSWVSSISEQHEYRDKLRTLILTLPRDCVIAIDKLRTEVGYPGIIEQFEQLLIQVHSREKGIGELDLSNGVFTTPKGDYFEDQFTKSQLIMQIREILEGVIMENSTIPANSVSYQLGHAPTSSFYIALNEVIDEFDRLEYSSVTGMIRSIITQSEFSCPICRQGFKSGQSIGACSKCKEVFHKNELRQYVLDKRKCPQCKEDLLYDQIETTIA
ncbi:MAG: RING finger protein, partial [Candidatus Kariarchaeaceae archaeon]